MVPTTALNVFTSPVGYFREAGYIDQLRKINGALLANKSLLKVGGEKLVGNAITNMFRFAAICGKHPGFREELEWRVVWCPLLGSPKGFEMTPIGPKGEIVCRVPMKNSGDLKGASPSELIQRIIVGPSADPHATRDEIITALEQAGVKDAGSRVACYDIPLRAAERVSN